MNYESNQNDSYESETLSADERKLSALLGSLQRVEAPKDFDFKLKAKIAAGAPDETRKTFLFPSLRYVLPLCLVMILTGFAALRILAPGEQPIAPTLADNFQPPQNFQEKTIVPEVSANVNLAVNVAAPEIVKVPKPTAAGKRNSPIIAVESSRKSGARTESKTKDNFVGERESAVKEAVPLNLSPNVRNPGTGQEVEIPIREVLSTLGIEVEFSGSGCRVVSVREGTSARIANFQPGDLIEAIDNKKLSSDTTFSESFKAKTFRVVRAGKQMVIDLTKR